IQMATINAARHFRLDHEIGSISPGRWADIILSEKISEIKPVLVLHKGTIIAREGKLASPPPNPVYPEWLYRTVKTTRGGTSQDFHLPASGEFAQVHVIEILPDQIINKSGRASLQVSCGHVRQDVSKDILKLAVVERHGKNGNIGISFVKGFQLQKGALSSSISHDHHNIVVVGADDESMATCIRETEKMQGGFIVALGGKVLGRLPLPIGGLMSPEKPAKIIEALDQINERARSLGCNLPAPFMTLSFISLPTVPELGLTDMGLVDVKNHQLISPFLI
ncbi:MAG: amidohydrolase family protein, partial [Anaerolineaceae bacterium]|nr:amidohydrolase family protein [Anaerolineaceae bacterium]